MSAEHDRELEIIRENIKNAESSLMNRFGGEAPSDPGGAVQNLIYAVSSLTDLLETLLSERDQKEEASPECCCAGPLFDPDTPCPVAGHDKAGSSSNSHVWCLYCQSHHIRPVDEAHAVTLGCTNPWPKARKRLVESHK